MPNDNIVQVRPGLSADIAALGAIERAAASVFASVDMAWVAEGDTLPATQLESWRRDGTLWVAADAANEPIGFLAAHDLDGALFIAEVDVLPEHQGRGIGRKLMQAAYDYGRSQGYGALTLTTYRDIAWNGPFYERLGFVEIVPDARFPSHIGKLRAEAAAGHDPARRCMMRRALP